MLSDSSVLGKRSTRPKCKHAQRFRAVHGLPQQTPHALVDGTARHRNLVFENLRKWNVPWPEGSWRAQMASKDLFGGRHGVTTELSWNIDEFQKTLAMLGPHHEFCCAKCWQPPKSLDDHTIDHGLRSHEGYLQDIESMLAKVRVADSSMQTSLLQCSRPRWVQGGRVLFQKYPAFPAQTVKTRIEPRGAQYCGIMKPCASKDSICSHLVFSSEEDHVQNLEQLTFDNIFAMELGIRLYIIAEVCLPSLNDDLSKWYRANHIGKRSRVGSLLVSSLGPEAAPVCQSFTEQSSTGFDF